MVRRGQACHLVPIDGPVSTAQAGHALTPLPPPAKAPAGIQVPTWLPGRGTWRQVLRMLTLAKEKGGIKGEGKEQG
eukprot:764967-Hanusia_phi.AAC.4